MRTEERTSSGAKLRELTHRLEPKLVHESALRDLDDLFRTGEVPDPLPDGFLRGRLITMSLTRPSDAAVRWITKLYMPWQGKAFDREMQTGVNVLTPSARKPLKVLWPSYEPEADHPDRLDAFPFRTRVDTGAIDRDLQVLKIDYDYDANPDFLIRHVLDELVQIEPGVYLGKILYRWRGSFRPIGFFSLET